jgi:LmbE family N-acetylglucosaminyl deacetylase
MVVSPHADDAELGCGGYMHQVTKAGGVVVNVVVAVGDMHFAHLGRTVSSQERQDELNASMTRLGCRWQLIFSDLDGRLDTVPLAHLVSHLDALIGAFRPHEVLIPLPSSHQDHEVVYRACIAACRPSRIAGQVHLIAAYEYPATSWGAGSAADAGQGGMYAEIGDGDLEAKLEALRCHHSQIRNGGHCWSLEAAQAMAAMRGIEAGVRYAELFHVMREVRRCQEAA